MDFSLIIGIDNYLHLKQTPFAENDAKEFHEIMKNVFKVQYTSLLLSSQATFINVENEIQKIIDRLGKEDRFIFFFAGHGVNLEDSPYLSMYDSLNVSTKIESSWHCVIELIKKINNTGCQKNLFFIDACQSTIKLGSRDINTRKFSFDDIEVMLKTNKHTCVFSSCSHKGVADVYAEKEHGIWSYFLLQAIRGDESKALSGNGCLTNVSLTNYLNLIIKDYCKSNKDCDIQQTYTWGKQEGEFLIFQFPETNVQAYKSIPKRSLKRIEFVTVIMEGVRQLKGFIKGTHSIPKYYSSAVDNFIIKIAEDDIKEHMESVSNSLRSLLNLKRKEFKVKCEGDYGVFECPYFTYSYNVSVNRDDLSTVKFTATLTPHDVNKLIEISSEMDGCFPNWFDFLLFTLEKSINIPELIDKIEEIDEESLSDYEYKYDNECSYLEMFDKRLSRSVVISNNEIKIKFKVREEIIDMLDSLRDVSNQMKLISPDYKLLG